MDFDEYQLEKSIKEFQERYNLADDEVIEVYKALLETRLKVPVETLIENIRIHKAHPNQKFVGGKWWNFTKEVSEEDGESHITYRYSEVD